MFYYFIRSLDELATKTEQQSTETKGFVRSNYFRASIGLCIIVGLILIGGVIIQLIPNDSQKSLGKYWIVSFMVAETELQYQFRSFN